jgi:large subunit ribosomal protein L32
MAVPFRRTSKTAKRLRRGHFKLEAKGLVACPHCGAMIEAHKVCPECGYYNGKDILHIKKEEPKKKAK